MGQKGRIEWIDTAKGICIIFVILFHICGAYGGDYVGSDVIQAFRMPLYFMLSGLFFKTYEGFGGFIKRKCNKLLIPYMFFYLTLTVIAPYLIYRISGFKLIGYADAPGIQALVNIFSEHIGANPPIWFLVCLFDVNILFYLIQMIGKRQWVVALLSFVFGAIGLWISWTNLPEYWMYGKEWYWWDSAFSMVPFFFFGWFLKNNSDFLYWKNSPRNVAVSVFFILGSVLLIHFYHHGMCWPFHNYYGSCRLALVEMYPYGIIGSIAILSLARMIKWIPLVSYIGRFSLIVLCTHEYVFQFIAEILRHFSVSHSFLIWGTFLLSVPVCALIIPFFKKVFPYFTAQKDLIPITSSKERSGMAA